MCIDKLVTDDCSGGTLMEQASCCWYWSLWIVWLALPRLTLTLSLVCVLLSNLFNWPLQQWVLVFSCSLLPFIGIWLLLDAEQHKPWAPSTFLYLHIEYFYFISECFMCFAHRFSADIIMARIGPAWIAVIATNPETLVWLVFFRVLICSCWSKSTILAYCSTCFE